MIQFKNQHLCIFESALYRTTSSVLNTADLILIVDPNWLPSEIIEIQQHVESLEKSAPERPVLLLFTHSDYDHILGYGAFPNAKVIASEAFVTNTDKQKVINQIKEWDDEYYVRRNYEIEYPVANSIVLRDAQVLEFGNTLLTFYLSPGHNPDGLLTIVDWQNPLNNRKQSICLAGDYFSNVEIPFIDFHCGDYENTLGKLDSILANHTINMLVPGHGDAAFTVEEMLNRKNLSLAYIHALKSSIKNGHEFNLDYWISLYDFPISMKKAHRRNVELVSREIMEQGGILSSFLAD
jgi:glyoxylase-like metal-dependent hydrolase (beta-lactamase superfamily II)